MDFLAWLTNHSLVVEYDVLDYYELDDATFLKLKIVLTDTSVLYTKEYIDEYARSYAFQWQRADNIWRMRWDNVPHFPKLASFRHHKHDYRSGSEVVTESFDISLAEVLAYIHSQLTNL
ncbi:DUF6516 family protein [soil metagenome]